MMRRRHKKSRKGCLECKKRHIKCDETRPRCINCATVERDCQYPAPTGLTETSAGSWPVPGSAFTAGSTPTSASASASASSLLLASESVIASSRPSPSPSMDVNPFPYSGELQTKVDMVHMELLHHYLTANNQIYPFIYQELKDTIVRVALREPFLMHSILAMAARHLSIARPAQNDYYRTLAIQLQTQALSLFNSFSVEYFAQSIERRVPAFLFSSVLGFHALCDMLSFRDGDYASTHARYVGYLRLHRGLLIVMDGHWEDLKRTELKILFDSVIPRWFELSSSGDDCREIIQIIEASGRFNAEELARAKRAIECLQWVFDAKPDYKSRVHVICSWAVLIPGPLVQMIEEGTPEAMVILAYYYVGLHFCRDVWLIGDAGKFLLTAVVNHLGSEWSSWLEKPLQMMREHDEEVLARQSVARTADRDSPIEGEHDNSPHIVPTTSSNYLTIPHRPTDERHYLLPMAFDFAVTRPSEADAGRIAEIHIAAMYSNLLLHAQFPTPDSLKAVTHFLKVDTADMIRDSATGILVARDPETGIITGFVKWTSPSHPENVKLESGDMQYLEGCRREFLDGYASIAEAAKERSAGDKPCYRINFVCTDPTYQGRGAGTLLTRKLLEMAEKDNLPVYLESTKVAVPMYEKLGFETIDSFQMKIPRPAATELSETYEEICMIWYPRNLTTQK